MAKPVFPVIEEGVTYNPGDLKESLGHLWYEGVENDINRRMIKSLDDLRRVRGRSLAKRAIRGVTSMLGSQKRVNRPEEGNASASNSNNNNSGSPYNLPERIARGVSGGIEYLTDKIGLSDPRNDEEREASGAGLNLFGKSGKYRKHSDLTDEQIKTLEQARGIGMRGLVHILNNLANPLPQLPISPLQQQATGISNSLAGPLLLSLLNQPSPSSFAPMYASQLAQQQGPGLSDMLGSLAAPALQAALPYIGSLFNRQG